MSLLFRNAKPESRSLSYQDVWGSGGNVDTAIGGPSVVSGGLRLIPVYAATSLICDMIATSPFDGYRTAADGSLSLLAKQPQIVTKPNPCGSRISWVHQAIASMLLRGNAYGYVTALGVDGYPSQIQWLNPDAVAVIEEQNDWFHTPQYYWRGIHLDPALVVHVPAYTMAGSYIGYSPLALFKMQIETGLQAQQFGSDWFSNNANPSGILRNTAKELTPEQSDTVKNKFRAAIANRDVFVTGNDWDYSSLSVQANESQFLETIKATATQIAAIYRVSPEDIGGEIGTSLTYKTLTQDATKLEVRALNPWATRLATAISDLRPGPQHVAFNLGHLSKGDRATRIAAHAAALTTGQETLAEARADEGKAPLTPDEVDLWQKFYAGKPDPAPPTKPTDPGV